jgi:hypothetical protein
LSNNVDITAGAGTSVATEQVSGTNEQIQIIKLAYSAAGSRVLGLVDANGVLVDLGANNDVTNAVLTDVWNNVTHVLSTRDNVLANAYDAVNQLIKVALPAATVVTLTPPAAITGFGLETTQLLQATAAHQVTAQASLTTLLAQTIALIYAQGATSASAVGPLMQGAVSDTVESYVSDTVRPLSITADGRLRVSTVPADIEQVWQHTFDNPWDVDSPWGGDFQYV